MESRHIHMAGLAFYEHHGFTSAAALSFWGVLTTVPFVLFFSGLLGLLTQWLGGGAPDALVSEMVAGLRQFLPRLDVEVARYLERVIAEGQTLSLAAVPLFLLMSSALLGTLETALGAIFHPTQKRTVTRSTLLGMAFVVALLFALVATVLAVTVLGRISGSLGQTVSDVLDLPFLTPIVIICLGIAAFVVLVRIFALVRVAWGDCLWGGLLFGVFWTLARLVFAWYLDTLASYDLVYGSFAVFVVVILWLYYTAALFLYSAEWVKVRRAL